MPDVAFHTDLGDKISYACRLLRKAVRQGHRVRVFGEASEIAVLDQALWTFEPREFLAHLKLQDSSPSPAFHRTPVWLQPAGISWPQALSLPPIVVNLGPEAVPDRQMAERVVELVGDDDGERRAARQRWRDYRDQGLTPRAVQAAA